MGRMPEIRECINFSVATYRVILNSCNIVTDYKAALPIAWAEGSDFITVGSHRVCHKDIASPLA